jgi:hypothetical protein
MNTDGMAGGGTTDEPGVRDLLERALADAAPVPGDGYADMVLARAGRIRRRRRAIAASATAVAAVAAVAAVSLLPGALGDRQGQDGGWMPAGGGPLASATNPAAAAVTVASSATPMPGGLRYVQVAHPPGASVPVWTPRPKPDQLPRLRALLPAGVGTATLHESLVGWSVDARDLDGHYLITKNGRVGGLSVVWGQTNIPVFSCSDPRQKEAGRLSCSVTELGGGRQLEIVGFGPRDRQMESTTTMVHMGPSYEALLSVGNQRVLHIMDVSGFSGPGAPGPAMAAPPLTEAQLAAFAQQPGLKAGAPQN